MKALLFKDLSDAYTEIELLEGKAISESITDGKNKKRIAVVNGEQKNLDYIVKEEDIIIIRTYPGHIAVVIVMLVIAVGMAIYAGVQAYRARKQAEELEDKMKNMNSSIKNIPYLRGANNTIATGNTQPYIIGRHLFTPYKLATGFNRISGETGETQHYYVVLQGGFNKQVLRSAFCDDVKIKTWEPDLATPQEGVYALDADSVFYDPDSLIEVAQDGNDFATAEFNRKIVVDNPGSEIKKSDAEDYEDLIFPLENYTRAVDVCIMFNGLRAYDDDGDKKTRTVTVIPEYSLDSGGSWVGFTFNQNGTASNTFAYNKSVQLRFNAHKDFTYAQVKDLTAPVLIRLRCTTPEYDGSASDSCYVQWIQSYIYNPLNSKALNDFVDEQPLEPNEMALSTMIGLKIKATLSNEDKLDRINVRTYGCARTWNGSEWTTLKTPTSNPAAWLLEVLTSDTHLASKIADTRIDLDSFGELYEYCETNSFHCNTVLTDGDTKETVLAMILDTCCSALYTDIYGKISVVTDKPKENAIAIINTQNCISFSNKKDMSRKVDGIKINYTSADSDYESDTYLVMRDGVTRNVDSIIREMTVAGIEEYEHIVKYARRILAIDQLRPKTASVAVGKEGTYYIPLAKVLVQHPSLKIGLGSAEIKSLITVGGYITGLVLYEPIQYDSSIADGFGVVIQAISSEYCTPIAKAYTAESNGYNTEIEFITPIDPTGPAVPHQGDILSYGYLNSGAFDTITAPMLITGIDPTDEGFTLTLIDYNEAVYTTGTIPEYIPNITNRKTPISVPTEVPGATKDELYETAGAIVSTRPTYAEIATGFTNAGLIIIPAQLNATAVGGFRFITITWAKQQNLSNLREYQIQCSEDAITWYAPSFDGTGTHGHGTVAGAWFSTTSPMLVHPNISPNGTEEVPVGRLLYYRVRQVTALDAVSDWSAVVAATTKLADTGDYAANSISLNALKTSELYALFATLSETLIIDPNAGLAAQNTDYVDGDSRTLLNARELLFQYVVSGSWVTIVRLALEGLCANQVYSNDKLIITNDTMAGRREKGFDIGIPYLSDYSHVCHYDSDLLDQNGDTYWTLTGSGVLVGKADGFTPAIVAVAPYAIEAKSLYGNFRLVKDIGITNLFTVDFWMLYYYNENQNIFVIGSDYEYVKIDVLNSEPYYNQDAFQYNDVVTEDTWYNEILGAVTRVVYHYDGNPDDIRYIQDVEGNPALVAGTWYHIGIIDAGTTLSVYVNNFKFDFTSPGTRSDSVIVDINPALGQFLIDEVMVDATVAETEAVFTANTEAKKPWAKLSDTPDWFILDVKNPAYVKTNLFESQVFQDAVLAIAAPKE